MADAASPGDAAMSLDSASSQQSAPVHRPTSTVQTIGTRWAVAAGHSAGRRGRRARARAPAATPSTPGVAAGFTLGVVHRDMVSVAGRGADPGAPRADRARRGRSPASGPIRGRPRREYFVTRHGGQIPPGLPRTVVPAAPDAWCTALERWGTMSFADADRAGPRARRARLRRLRVLRLPDGRQRRQVPPVAELDRALPARRPRATAWARCWCSASWRDARAHGRRREAGGRRARGRHPRRARRVLPRRDGQAHRRVPSRQRGTAGAGRPGRLQRGGRAGAAHARSARYEVAACGFWCQGPVLLQMLNMLDGLDLAALGHNSPAYLHRLVETIKLAFSDRDAYYGDPNFVKVPAERLLSKAYARGAPRAGARAGLAGDAAGRRRRATRARGCCRSRAAPRTTRSTPATWRSSTPRATASRRRRATPTSTRRSSPASAAWCRRAARRAGSIPSHAERGRAGQAAAPHPGARHGAAGRQGCCMPFGTPGGDVQQQAMLQVFLNVTVFGMPLQEAIEAPRVASRSFPDSFWPHAYSPGKLEAERRIAEGHARRAGRPRPRCGEWPDWEWRAGAVVRGARSAPRARAGAAPTRAGERSRSRSRRTTAAAVR